MIYRIQQNFRLEKSYKRDKLRDCSSHSDYRPDDGAVTTSETSVNFYKTTRRNILEHRCPQPDKLFAVKDEQKPAWARFVVIGDVSL
jgi:hypothetical protein